MPTALITGASSGIGLELARIFARNGFSLTLVARNAKRLDEIAKELSPVLVAAVPMDLSKIGAAEELFSKTPKTDILVNNAGYGVFGKFAETPLPDELSMMQLNMRTLVILTKLYLPAMIAARSARI